MTERIFREVIPCPGCGGQGIEVIQHRERYEYECEDCDKTGKILSEPVTLGELTSAAVKAQRERIKTEVAKLLITPEEMAKADVVSGPPIGPSARWQHNAIVQNALMLIDPPAAPATPEDVLEQIFVDWDHEEPAGDAFEMVKALASKGYKVVSE